MKILLRLVLLFLLLLVSALFIAMLWLQTSDVKIAIPKYLDHYAKEKLGISVQVEGLDIALPIIIKAKRISLADNQGNFANAEDFSLNILPSLFSFWQLTIWKISADKIEILKAPNLVTKVQSNFQSFFNPDILIQEISVKKMMFGPGLTKLSRDVVTSLNSYLDYSLSNGYVNFSNQSVFPLSEYGYAENGVLDIVGNYDFINNKLNINLDKLDLPGAKIQGGLVMHAGKLKGAISYEIASLEPVLKNALGKSSGKIDILGTTTRPEINTQGQLSLKLLDFDYLNLPDIKWSGNFALDGKDVNGSISLNMEQITAKSQILWREQKLHLHDLKIAGDNFTKDGSLIFDLSKKSLTGIVRAKASSLKELAQFLPFINDGSLDIESIYSYANNQQSAKLTGKINNLSTKYGAVSEVDIDVNIIDLWVGKLNNSMLALRLVNINDFLVENCALNLDSTSGSMKVRASIESVNPFPISLSAESIIPSFDKIRISKLSGNIIDAKLENSRDIVVRLGDDYSVDASGLKISDGHIDLLAMLKGNDISLDAKLINVPVFLNSAFLPVAFKGSLISGGIKLSGKLADPTLQSNLETNNISINANEKLKLKANIEADKNLGAVSASVFRGNDNLANLNISIPIAFSFKPLDLKIKEKEQMLAKVKFYQPVELFSMIPMPLGHHLNGVIEGGAEVSGTWSMPIINGKLLMREGAYTYSPYGIKLNNIKTDLIASSGKLEFLNLEASDIFGKSLSGKGNFLFSANRPFNFEISANNFALINSLYLQGKSNINIEIKGDKNKAMAKGSVELGPLDIKIPEKFSYDIPTLNIIKVITDQDKIAVIKNKVTYPFMLDLAVSTSEKVYVRGWGLNTLLGGKLHITGPVSDPFVTGSLRSIRGNYKEFGKSLRVSEGVLSFDGKIPPSPFLRVVGLTNESGVEIRLVLSGSIMHPDISIESVPAMSQEDALSLLLFGKNPENISTFQALQLADSLRRLSGQGGGRFDPLGLGRQILGVDEINIKSDKDNPEKSSVGVGKYLTEKVYLEIEQGTGATGVKSTIEVELTPKISLESTTGENGQSSFGVNWKFDY